MFNPNQNIFSLFQASLTKNKAKEVNNYEPYQAHVKQQLAKKCEMH